MDPMSLTGRCPLVQGAGGDWLVRYSLWQPEPRLQLLGQFEGLLWTHSKPYICCSFALTSILLWCLFNAHYCDIWEQRSLRTDTVSTRKQNFVLFRSRRILLIHKAHQSMFHTMQAMCILYTSHSTQAEIAVAYPSVWKIKNKNNSFSLLKKKTLNHYFKPTFCFLD